jgi:hypothetical protein
LRCVQVFSERSAGFDIWSKEIPKIPVWTKVHSHYRPQTAFGNPGSAIPTLAALRMQWWALILMAYAYEVEY